VQGGPPVGHTGEPTEYVLYVRFSDRRAYRASILAADPRSDLAVLQIDLNSLGIEADQLKPLKIGDASGLRKGQIVLALGNPYAIAREGSASASWGMVSNIARRPAPVSARSESDRRTEETIHHYGTLIQVDTRLNLGTSGGALLNLKGELIGVTTALAALEGYETSVGYAIPLDATMRRVIDTLVGGHEVEYGFLGVVPRTAFLRDLQDRPEDVEQVSAARIESVMHNSPASDGGLRQGDVILAVNGTAVFDHFDLMREVGGLGPGAVAHLWIWREQDESQREQTKTAKLGKWPAVNEEEIIATKSRHPAWRGIWIDYPTGRERFTDQYSYLRAVAIAKVESGSVAAAAGLRPNEFIRQVNQTPVSNPAAFYQAVDGLSGEVTLQIDDGRGNIRRVVVGR
jgi:serine protease Do